MNRRTGLAIAGVAIVLVILLYWRHQRSEHHRSSLAQRTLSPSPQNEDRTKTSESPNTSATTKAPAQTLSARQRTINNVLGSLSTPITFYGKVIDQNGNPVEGANVRFGTIDKFDAEGSHYETKSDAAGLFSIAGIRGAVLTVGAWKQGFYNIDGKSDGSFAYGVGPDPTRKSPPTKESPAVFILQKAGPTEPLIQVERHVRVPRNGDPVELDLRTGRNTLSGHGDFKVEAWTEDETPTVGRHYNWRCRISVPNGGLVERSAQFDFEAPTEGYRSSDEIVMRADAERWSPAASRQYFLRLSNDLHARVEFEMAAAGDHFFSITSYLNPTPGSRNLEFDPAKQIKPK